MNPNTLLETLTRELQRFGHVSWLRRALEWCGVVRKPKATFDTFRKAAAVLHRSGEMPSLMLTTLTCRRCGTNWPDAIWGPSCPGCDGRARQIPAAWQATDETKREGER